VVLRDDVIITPENVDPDGYDWDFGAPPLPQKDSITIREGKKLIIKNKDVVLYPNRTIQRSDNSLN
jgi:hypothetical protein